MSGSVAAVAAVPAPRGSRVARLLPRQLPRLVPAGLVHADTVDTAAQCGCGGTDSDTDCILTSAASTAAQQRCQCPQQESDRFGSHLRPPPLWPRDGGGTGRRHRDAHRDVCRGRGGGGPALRPPPLQLQPLPLAVLLLVGRLLPASAAAAPGTAPGAAPGLTNGHLSGMSSATVPPLPPMPQLSVASYRAMGSPAPQSLVNQLVMEKLDKLDERLRGLTDIYWDIRYRLDTVERRLGDMDGKVDRRLGDIEGALGRRLDKLSEAVAAHDHKDSSAKEQLGRKVDNVYERVVYMDINSVSKLQQTVVDKAASASAELQRAVGQADQAVGKAAAATLNAVLAAHAQLNATHDLVLNTSRAAAAATTSPDDAEESEAGQRACVDASDTAAKTIKQHIDTKADLMSSKVSKLYNDMWRRVNELESTVKTVISLSNATRRDVQTLNVAALGSQHGRGYHPRQPVQESGLEYALNLHDDSVSRQLSGLRDALLDELQNVQGLQNTFLSTCNRLNDKDLDVEDKLSRVLSHHTDYLLEHRHVLDDIKRQLKTHNTLTSRAAANATEGTKRVESVVRGLADQSRRMEETLARLHNMTAAVQNATERASSAGCGIGLGLGRLGPVEEEAAWSALLQHNTTLGLAEPTEGEQLSATSRPPEDEERATPLSEDHQRGGREASRGAVMAVTTPASTGADSSANSGELLLVDSNGLHRQTGSSAPRHEAVEGNGNGLQGQTGGPAGRREAHAHGHTAHTHTGQDRQDGASTAMGSVDNGQDSMTDLSSVDDEDYTEENDDETDFID